MKIVDLEAEKPLYLQMKKILKERFLSGGKNITKLPTEIELASEYNVNRILRLRRILKKH